jgi:hypothetical protein
VKDFSGHKKFVGELVVILFIIARSHTAVCSLSSDQRSRRSEGMVGRDSASAAQSKHGGAGAAHISMKLRGGGIGDRGCKTAVAGGLDMSAAMVDGGGHEMAHLWGSWGKQGGWGTFLGCSDVSRCVFRCSGAAVHGSEWDRVGG